MAMQPIKLRHFSIPIVVFTALIILTGTADAQVRVGGASLRFNGEIIKGHEYTGACPVDLKFGWSLISTEPTIVTYTFTRSDGAHTSQRTINIPQANKSVFVYDNWRIGANKPQFTNYQGWVELVVESPNAISQRTKFTLHCQ